MSIILCSRSLVLFAVFSMLRRQEVRIRLLVDGYELRHFLDPQVTI